VASWTVGPADDGLHAFVFVDHTDQPIGSVLGALRKLSGSSHGRVVWAGSFIGDYRALVHVSAEDADDLGGIQDFIERDLWGAGVRCTAGTELKVANFKGTKRSTPDIVGIVGIRTAHGAALAVMEEIARRDPEFADDDARIDGFVGASLLTGHVDILLQLNADSLTGLHDLLLQPSIASIDGIVSTSTAVGDGGRSPF